MHLTQTNRLRNLDKNTYQILTKLSSLCKNMYNVGVYNTRQHFFENGDFLSYAKNYHLAKENENYPLLVSIGQCILKQVDAGFRSFFALLKKKRAGGYDAKVRMPGYLPKDSYYPITWNATGIKIKNNKVRLTMSGEFKKQFQVEEKYLWFPIPPFINQDNIQEVKITNHENCKYFKIHFAYKKEAEVHELDSNEYLSIDLGVNNFATCVDTKTGSPFILDGRKLKSINQFWNKRVAKLKSILEKQEPNPKRFSK